MPISPTSIDRTGFAPIRIVASDRDPNITAASRLCLSTIDLHPDLIHGRGIDWGSGTGILTIAAATHRSVEFALGLEVDAEQVAIARTNTELNGVADRTGFLVSDSYRPMPGQSLAALDELRGSATFLIANPPTSSGDDGLGWRRRVLHGALDYLIPGAEVLLQVSRQYGEGRTERLATDVGGFVYRGPLETTDWVPFDQSRADLRAALYGYVAEEQRSGEPYSFLHPDEDVGISAAEAQDLFATTSASPRSQWRMHRFTRLP